MRPLAADFRERPLSYLSFEHGLWIALNDQIWGRVVLVIPEGYITTELIDTLSKIMVQ